MISIRNGCASQKLTHEAGEYGLEEFNFISEYTFFFGGTGA
jgi:hypothetical protein